MTPRYPGARWRPTNQNSDGTFPGGRGEHAGYNNGPSFVTFHVAVSDSGGEGIASWNESDYNHCHGYVERFGKAWQYVDFNFYAAGVLDGNYRGGVTWETWDGLNPRTAVPADLNIGYWTPQQCERLADVAAFDENELGIPSVRMHSTRDCGHGPHATGIPHRVGRAVVDLWEGPDHFSTDDSKSCCGNHRIFQMYGPNLDGGAGSILERGRVIAAHVRAGGSYLPQGDVDLPSALSRGGGEFSILDWISIPSYI